MLRLCSPYSQGIATAAVLLIATSLASAEPTGWRGNGSSYFPDAQPPLEWSPENNVLWKLKLPGGGYASPVLCDERLFVMSNPAELLCIDATTGQKLWQQSVTYASVLGEAKDQEIVATYEKLIQQRQQARQAYETARKANPADPQLDDLKQAADEAEEAVRDYVQLYPQEGQPRGCGNAAATPVCDGQHVYLTMGTGIVAAFDLEGRRLWARHVESPFGGWGHSTSPVLADGKLIVHFRDLVALDPATGDEVWRTEHSAKYGTPIVTTIEGQAVLVTPAGGLIRAADGKVLAEKLFQLSNNSPLVHDGVIYAHEGGAVKAIRLPATLAEAANPEVLWETRSTRDSRMTSAAYCQGLLYAGGRGGIMDVIDAQTGKMLYRRRLNVGELFASVVVAGDVLLVSGKDGKTLVLRPGRNYEELAVNELERFSSTPLVHGDRVYVRTDATLYCIGKPSGD